MSAKSIPTSIKVTVLLVVMSEHTLSFMMPTIMVYMVERLGSRNMIDVSDVQVVSFWVGILEGSNRVFALFGCIAWGAISDKIGRKNSLLIILSGIGLCSLGLGLSYNLWWALAFRIIAGFFAGTIPTLKALMRDVSDDSNISILYSYFGTGYGAASILGPIIGGLFSNPGNSNYFWFNNTFIEGFPYFYPMLFHSICSFCAALLVIYNIPSNSGISSNKKSSYSTFLKSKYYLLSSLTFFCIAFAQFSYRSLLALWLNLDTENEGIGWKTEVMPGIMNCFSGFIVMLLPLILTDRIERRLGIRYSCILVSCLTAFPLAIISYGYHLTGFWLMIFLIVFNGLCVAFTTILVSIISIAVSNTVTSDVAGIAIGLTQAFVNLSRGIGNGGTAMLFGYLQNKSLGLAIDFHILFFSIILVFIIICCLLKFTLDDTIEKRKKLSTELPLITKT